jgi:HSP20 family protein
MTKLRVWNPWAMTPRDFFDMDDAVFSDDIQMNVYELDDNVVVELKAAGFSKDDIEIRVEGTVITVSGSVKSEEEEVEKKKKYYRKEIREMSFTRSTELPALVDGEKAEATFKDGVLKVSLPKREEAKPKRIDIKAM